MDISCKHSRGSTLLLIPFIAKVSWNKAKVIFVMQASNPVVNTLKYHIQFGYSASET